MDTSFAAKDVKKPLNCCFVLDYRSEEFLGSSYAAAVGLNGRFNQLGRRLPSGLVSTADRVMSSHCL